MNQKRLFLEGAAAAVFAIALSACGGGATQGAAPLGSGTSPSPLAASPSPTAVGATASPSPTASGAAPSASPVNLPPSASPTPGPTTTTVPAGTKVYVVNHTKNGATGQTPSITVYLATASGNVAPVQTIAGAATGLAVPQFIAIDNGGDIWVTNEGNGASTSGTVEEFAPNADNDATPIATITGLNTPEGIFVDSAGDIYIDTVNTINEYAPGTTGANPTPMKQIGAPANAKTDNAGLAGPYGLKVDSSGNIYVAQEEAIYVFDATLSGNVAPSQDIVGQAALFASDLDVALDSSGNIYCTNFDGVAGTYTINEYASTATGNTAPSNTFTSVDFDEPIGIAFDKAQNIYIANYGNNSVDVLTGGMAGAATPAVISGASTGLESPYGIAVH